MTENEQDNVLEAEPPDDELVPVPQVDLDRILGHCELVCDKDPNLYGNDYRSEVRRLAARAIELALRREELYQELWSSVPREEAER